MERIGVARIVLILMCSQPLLLDAADVGGSSTCSGRDASACKAVPVLLGQDLDDASALQTAPRQPYWPAPPQQHPNVARAYSDCMCPFPCADHHAEIVTGPRDNVVFSKNGGCLKLSNTDVSGSVTISGSNASLMIEAGTVIENGIVVKEGAGHICVLGDPRLTGEFEVLGAKSVTICGTRASVPPRKFVAPALKVLNTGNVMLHAAPDTLHTVVLADIVGQVDILDTLSPDSDVVVHNLQEGHLTIRGSVSELTHGTLFISMLHNAGVTLDKISLSAMTKITEVTGSGNTVSILRSTGAYGSRVELSSVGEVTVLEVSGGVEDFLITDCHSAHLAHNTETSFIVKNCVIGGVIAKDNTDMAELVLEDNGEIVLARNKGQMLSCVSNVDLIDNGCNVFMQPEGQCSSLKPCPP